MKQFKKIQYFVKSLKTSLWMALCVCVCSLLWVPANAAMVEGGSNGLEGEWMETSHGVHAGVGVQDSLPKAEGRRDSTRLKIGGLKIIIKDKDDGGEMEIYSDKSDGDYDNKKDCNGKVRTRYFMLDLGFNTYLSDGSFNLPSELNDLDLDYGKSLNVNLHLFRQRIGLIGNNLNFMYGLELAWNNYHFENDITLIHDADALMIVDNNIDFKKNKLATTYLQMPVLFNIETNPRQPEKSFRISGGAYGGLLLGARTKQKSSENGKVKIKDDFNINKFRYGVIGQVGIGPVNFYVDYALNSLFKDGEGPDLRPLSIGFTLIPF
ncbi:MAG: outer membrane beta-barrel protein [Chitinophagales bacterium]